MIFDKTKVFTALNADELKIGSKVVVSESIENLKFRVEDNDMPIDEITSIISENYIDRFEIKRNGCCYTYTLAYLVEEPQEQSLKWTDLKLGDALRGLDTLRVIVIGINVDLNTESHILLSSVGWITDENLKDWELIMESSN